MTPHYGLAYVTRVVKEALQSSALTLLVRRGKVICKPVGDERN